MAKQQVLVTGPFGEAGEAILNHLAEKDAYEFTYLNRTEHPDYETFVADVVDAFDPKLLVSGGARGFHDALDLHVDAHISDGDPLDGDLRVVQVPGHTVATTGLLLEDDGVFIAGDILEGSDRRGLPAGYLVPPAEQFNDLSHAQAERNLVKLFEHDIETVLVSHGSHVYEDPLEKLNDWLIDREWDLQY